MRETEILRGLNKAKVKRNAFATGMVPVQAPAQNTDGVLSTVRNGLGSALRTLTGGATPVDVVTKNSGMTGMAATALKSRGQQIESALRDAGAYATGTPEIHGPGTSTSDSITAHLSDGEAVLPAKTVQAVGPKNLARLIEATNGIKPKMGLHASAGYAIGTVPEDPSLLSKATSTVSDAASKVGNTLRSAFSSGATQAAPVTPAAPAATTPLQSVTAAGQDAVDPAAKMSTASKPFSTASVTEAAPAAEAGGGVLRTLGRLATSPLAIGAGLMLHSADAGAGSDVVPGVEKQRTPINQAQADAIKANPSLSRSALEALGDANTINSKAGVTPATPGAGGTTSGTIPSATPADAAAPVAPVAPPVYSQAPADIARTIRSGQTNIGSFQPGTGVVTTSGGQGTLIDSRGQAQRPGQNTTSGGGTSSLADAKNALAQYQVQPGDSWQERADKKRNMAIAMAQGDLAKSELSSADTRYVSDNTLSGNKMANRAAAYKLQNDMHNTKVQQNGDVFQSLFPDFNAKGDLVKGGANHAAAMDKLVGTAGKYGLDIGDLSPQDLNQFKDLYDTAKTADEFNNSTKGKLFQALLQSRAATSRDVTQYNPTEEHPGAILNDTTRGVAGRIPNSVTYQNGEIFGVPNQDKIDFTKRKLSDAKRPTTMSDLVTGAR